MPDRFDAPRVLDLRARRRAGLRAVAALFAACLAPVVRGRDEGPHARFAARAYANRDRAVREGDQPYGAVLVCNGEIVADGVSAVVTLGDATAHAEMQALRLAMLRLGRTDLSGCTLYGTSPACPMCESAAAAANISRMYHGRDASGGERPRQRGASAPYPFDAHRIASRVSGRGA